MPSVDVSIRSSQIDHRSQDDDDDDESSIAILGAMSIEVDCDESSTKSTSVKSANYNGYSQSSAMPAPATRVNGLTPSSATNQSSSQVNGPSAKVPSLRSLLRVPSSDRSSGANTLGVPPSTTSLTAPAGIGGASGARIGGNVNNVNKDGLQTLPSEIAPKRRKVVLGPGCSALDWARLKSTIPSQGFRKIKPSELKLHKSEDDAWSAFSGKVYDMTPYLKFHPGGKEELMRVAGRDGTRLFMLTHSWVNIDSMIDSCLVGILISENSS